MDHDRSLQDGREMQDMTVQMIVNSVDEAQSEKLDVL